MKKQSEKLNKDITRLAKFYQHKMKEAGGGMFFIPILSGRRMQAVWGRSLQDVKNWCKKERLYFDSFITLH